MDAQLGDRLAEIVDLLRQLPLKQLLEQQQAQQPPRRVWKVARMLDIAAHLPEHFTVVEDGFAYIVRDGRRYVKVVLPQSLRKAAPEDLRDILFVFSVDLMQQPDGDFFTSVRGRPIDQGAARARLALRPAMVGPLAQELARLRNGKWCTDGLLEVLAEMAVPVDS